MTLVLEEAFVSDTLLVCFLRCHRVPFSDYTYILYLITLYIGHDRRTPDRFLSLSLDEEAIVIEGIRWLGLLINGVSQGHHSVHRLNMIRNREADAEYMGLTHGELWSHRAESNSESVDSNRITNMAIEEDNPDRVAKRNARAAKGRPLPVAGTKEMERVKSIDNTGRSSIEYSWWENPMA